ncbi:MAG: dihydrolipoyl dehydrogenase [Caldiserica bacterium]|nr:MAG: dihydrolipoyl dehydrogenase [Caldisericota bacterium]
MEEFDVAIIGAGSGGYVAAIRAADLGKKVAIIEHREIGGTCLNRGCIPTKALLKMAEIYTCTKESQSFGTIVGNVSFDPNAIQRRKDAVIQRLVAGINFLFKARKIVVKKGNGKFLDPHTIEITSDEGIEKIKAKDIIIATGSEPAMMPAFKIDRKNVLTSDEALNITEYPKSILIVGAGAIGVEFSTIFSTFGTKVTIVEMMPQVIPALKDRKLASMLQRTLIKKGIEIKTGIKIDNIEIQGNGNVVSTLSNGEEITTEKVLVSIGRKLNSTGIGIEELGIKTEKGKILVDEKLRTNIPNIYAIGDVIGGLLLAHKAQKEGGIVAEIIAGKDKKMDYRVVPWAIFSSPEIASVGLTEEEAKENSIDTIVSEFPFIANGKAVVMNSTDGEVKIIAKNDTKEIIGAQIFGPEASMIIAELALAVENKLTLNDIAYTVHVHPTLPETVMEVAKNGLEK